MHDAVFWSDIFQTIFAAVVSAGVVGSGFWVLLGKGIDAKVNRLIESYKVELASQLHKQNTVFTRIDQQRADAIQKIGAVVCTFRWEFTDFSPKYGYAPPGEYDNPTQDVLAWCAHLTAISKEALKTAFENALVLSLNMQLLIGAWHTYTQDASINLMERFMQLIQSTAYSEATPIAKRAMLTVEKQQWDAAHMKGLAHTNNTILNELREAFESVDRPKNIDEKYPVQPSAVCSEKK